jgi:hypothetical protein
MTQQQLPFSSYQLVLLIRNRLCLYEQRRSRKEEGAYVAPTARMNGLVSLPVNFLLIAVVVTVL